MIFFFFFAQQVYQDGRAAIDYGHVIESLNKLDAGIDEKIVLMSRDEQSMLVVRFVKYIFFFVFFSKILIVLILFC